MSGIAHSLLGIHLIGPGYGESIVVELPDGRAGVVDCYRSRPRATPVQSHPTNPTLRFLQSKGIQRLAFVALTHPHEDHGQGMSQVLEHFKNRIDQVWMFRAWDTAVYLEKCCVARKRKWRRKIKDECRREPGSFAFELLQIRHLVLKQCCDPMNNARGDLKEFHSDESFQCSDLTVRFLGPELGTATDYVRRMTDRVEQALDTGVEDWQEAGANHNVLSPAILFKYGEARILLGGDMETSAWGEAITKAEACGVSLRSHFIKISHHGSQSGVSQGMYQQLTIPSRSVAALTPCRKGRNRLPDRYGIADAYPCVTELFATNATAAAEGTDRFNYRTVPPHWVARLQEQPGLSAILAEDVYSLTTNDYEPCDTVPREFVRDVHEEPSLADTLADKVVESAPVHRHDRSNPEDTCRVSFFFDVDGREVLHLRHIGGEAGSLAWHRK